jgi:3-deoxy-D-arabino-heptulosonate 7-phosphate (DAHP) synthase class II
MKRNNRRAEEEEARTQNREGKRAVKATLPLLREATQRSTSGLIWTIGPMSLVKQSHTIKTANKATISLLFMSRYLFTDVASTH